MKRKRKALIDDDEDDGVFETPKVKVKRNPNLSMFDAPRKKKMVSVILFIESTMELFFQ